MDAGLGARVVREGKMAIGRSEVIAFVGCI